ncbi:MAG: CPBP family intramembrane glutamic endopeptidase [Planctomycetota bacterium]
MNVPEVPVPVLVARFVAAFAMLAIGPVLLWDAFRGLGFVADNPTVAANVAGSMGALLVAAAAVAAFAIRQRPASPWYPVAPFHVFAAYVPFVLAWGGLLFAYLGLVQVTPQLPLEYLATRPFGDAGFWLVIAGITIAAPVAEEIVFRGYLQGALLRVMPPWAAIGLTAAVFGLAHTLPYALPVGLLGAFFGWLSLRHRSLLAPIAAHSLHNAVTVAVTLGWPGSLDVLYRR